MSNRDAAIVALLREIVGTAGYTPGTDPNGCPIWAVPQVWRDEWQKRADALLEGLPITCRDCTSTDVMWTTDVGPKEPAAEHYYRRLGYVCDEHSGWRRWMKAREEAT